MKHAVGHILYRIAALSWLLVVAMNLWADDGEWLSRKVRINESKDTRYQLLRNISEQTGYLFVYDSKVIDNNAEVKITKGEYTLRDAIYAITGNPRIQISLIGNHILLSLPEQKPVTSIPVDLPIEDPYVTVTGMVYDLFSKESIPSATIRVANTTIGTITNLNGRFRIVVPDSLLHSSIKISHVGYENVEAQISLLADKQTDFMLEPKVISLQEVVVRAVNPRLTLQRMLQEREKNYASAPVYVTAFYREGVEHKKRNVDLTEAVLKVYKPGSQRLAADQVKLVKRRRIMDRQEEDTILTKVKSGIQSVLLLDIMKNLPEFLEVEDPENPYTYVHADISVVDDRLVNVISFEQKEKNKEPLYKGRLFIDTENHALLEARFELNPEYVEKATGLFVEKKSKLFKLTLRGASYVVSYKPLANGAYCINHVRGDLEFRVRRKRHWFSSTLKVWFELVNCKVDAKDVQPFPRSERLSTRTVFSDFKYPYDESFWGHLNVILPEEQLKEFILNNLSEVAGSEY